MANTKNYSLREKILDYYLSRGWYSRRQLEDACNRELEGNNELPISSRQTLLNDFLTIENKYHTIIETKRKGKVTFYRYKDRCFSIFNSCISKDDYDRLTAAVEMLRHFEGMPQFEWIQELGVRLNSSFWKSEERAVVGFSDTPYNKGMEYYTPLFNAIKDKITLSILYQSFKYNVPTVYTVSPYYLKQYNNRWFLLCKSIGFDSISTFPLDRIVEINNAGKAYEETNIDFDEYFEDVIGVSVTDLPCQAVEIWFNTEQLNYVETKPLHGSQRIIHRDNTGGIARYDLRLNYELEQEILSFGEKAKVLAPKELKEKIKNRINEAYKIYR